MPIKQWWLQAGQHGPVNVTLTCRHTHFRYQHADSCRVQSLQGLDSPLQRLEKGSTFKNLFPDVVQEASPSLCCNLQFQLKSNSQLFEPFKSKEWSRLLYLSSSQTFQTTASSPFPVMVWTPVYHSHTYPLSVPDPNLCKPAVPAFPPDVAICSPFYPCSPLPLKENLTNSHSACKQSGQVPAQFFSLPPCRKKNTKTKPTIQILPPPILNMALCFFS